jgi:hypothetical protein
MPGMILATWVNQLDHCGQPELISLSQHPICLVNDLRPNIISEVWDTSKLEKQKNDKTDERNKLTNVSVCSLIDKC